jgi:hypothetical protein
VASAGDWTTYVADYCRRKPTTAEDTYPVVPVRD